MKFVELYKRKKTTSSIKLNAKDIQLALKDVECKISADELKYILLLLDSDVDDSTFYEVKKAFKNFSGKEKAGLFRSLVEHVYEISIEVLLESIPNDDFALGIDFFDAFLNSNKVSCIDKFIFYREIATLPSLAGFLDHYTEMIIGVADVALSDSNSLKGEVRMAVATLKKVSKAQEKGGTALELLDSKYRKNDIWKEWYDEEIKHRQNVLRSSFGARVSEAFRNKDYRKVVKMIGDYEDELPETLSKKLIISRKKLE